MELIQDSEYVVFKAISENIIKGLEKPLKKLESKIDKLAVKFEKIRSQFLSSESYEVLSLSSTQLASIKNDLIKLCAVHDRIEKIVSRNNKRLAYYQTKLDAFGIYNYQVDKKDYLEVLKKSESNVNESSLNLNPYKNEGITYKFFSGKILAFKDDKLDLSLIENEEVLKSADAGFFHDLVETFPYAVATIPDEFYIYSVIRYNVLKECILFVASKSKKQSIAESNKELGGLLANVGNISNISEFAKALNNYLQVSVKQCFKKNSPELLDDIDKTIKCNESSEFLPRSKRVAVLANGMMGDAPKNEVQQSEEERKDQEKEAQNEITREQLLEMLLADDEDDLEIQENQQETAKKAEEERKLNEKKEDELELEELQKELELGLKKNDTVDE